jgi:hypothetical protein
VAMREMRARSQVVRYSTIAFSARKPERFITSKVQQKAKWIYWALMAHFGVTMSPNEP